MTCLCANTLFGDSAGDEALNVLRPVLTTKRSHLGFAIYKGNMNTQFTYVDANNAYVVARSLNEHNVSASPSFINHASNYVQGPMQQNIHDSTSYNFSNMQHMYPNSHASATPQIYMPMNNMMSSVNQVETPYVGTSNGMQQSVSSFYSSANNLQCVNPNVPMDRAILLVIWPITLKHHMLHVMLLIFWHQTQLLMSIIRLRAFMVMAE